MWCTIKEMHQRKDVKQMPDIETAAQRIKELRELIEYHSNAYYNADAPEIEDDEYDALMRELKQQEAQYPEQTVQLQSRLRIK